MTTTPDRDDDDDGPRSSQGGGEGTRLVLIRHGESQVTVERVIGGFRTCSGLSALGRTQSERLAERLAKTGELDGGVLVTSNFVRAIETAEFIAPAMNVSPEQVREIAGFGEHDPGPDIDGMSFDAYVERFGSPNWDGDPHADVFPGGETTAQFHLRVASALSLALEQHAGELIVIACHGGVIDAVFRQLLKTAPTGVFDLWTLNTSITEFKPSSLPASQQAAGDTRWRLVRYNDASHLDGLPDATSRTPASNGGSQRV